jgi:hypothetical protein
MTERDDEANRRHPAALVGGPGTRWREHCEQDVEVRGVRWDKLPLKFRRSWWKATDYNQHPPSPGWTALAPALLAAAQAKLEAATRKAKTDTIRARAALHRAEVQLPCGQCRPLTSCRVRCLAAILGPAIVSHFLDEEHGK